MTFNTNKLLTDCIWALKELDIDELEISDKTFNYFSPTTKISTFFQPLTNNDNHQLVDKYIEFKKRQFKVSINPLLDTQLRQLLSKTNIERIYFHCGTPKTGSSSFQSTAFNQVECLESHSLLYPSFIKSHDEPKHQKLVTTMRNKDVNGLIAFFKMVFTEATRKNLHQVIISTEGLFNHWNDFSDSMKMIFSTINEFIPVRMLLVLREPVSFLYSMYQQNLINPQMKHIDCYGKDLSFEEMLNDSWFVNHIDYMGFILAFESMICKESIQLISYSEQVVPDLFDALGLSLNADLVLSKNITSKHISLSGLRKINRLNLSKKEKLKQIELVTSSKKQPSKSNISANTKKKIDALFLLQRRALVQLYGHET